MSITKRPDEATPEAIRARLRQGVHSAGSAPASGATSSSPNTGGVDLRQLAREVERVRLEDEQHRRKAEADEAEARRHASARGGPCAFCGITTSYRRQNDGPAIGEWHTLTVDQVCAYCSDDLDDAADDINETWTTNVDDYHRRNIITQLVGTNITKFWFDQFLLPAAREAGFVWWRESGAPATDHKRFAHIDIERLRLLLDPSTRAAALPQPEPEPLVDGVPCPRCGCRHMWMVEPTPTATATNPYAHAGRMRAPARPHVETLSFVCVGCQPVTSLGEMLSRLLGTKLMRDGYDSMRPPIGTTLTVLTNHSIAQLGVGWYADLPDDDPRRALTAAPFQYLGDLGELRRRAIDLWPGREHWRHQGLWQMLTDERDERLRLARTQAAG